MSKEYLEITLRSANGKARYSAAARQNPELVVDYFPPVGTGEGYTSLELLMISFTSCISTVLVTLLRTKMQKTVTGITASAKGTVRDEHPKALSRLDAELIIASPDAAVADVERALAVSEEKLCPVWSMIKGNVEINVSFTIIKE